MLGKYGELGNQLFQICTTIAHAKRNNTNPVFPQWICGKQFKVYSHILKTPLDESLNIEDIKYVYNEQGHAYQELPYHENMSIVGYYQSELYFKDYEDYIREELLSPADNIIAEINKKYGDIVNATDTVAVHIRTQTRAKDDDAVNHTPPPSEYLKKAFSHYGKNYRYVIFSDNINLVKQWFKDYDFTYIENEQPNANLHNYKIKKEPLYANVLELFLMSKCKHHILTSSTFGWWGAWLNKNKNKQIIAMPGENWFGKHLGLNMSTFIPKSWTTIQP